MNIAFPRIALLFVATTFAPFALAGEADFSVSDAYVRAVPPGTPTTAAFMTIRNNGNADRKLLKAASPIAKTVELHNHINDNGVMRMRQVKEIEVKAKGQAELKSGSYHVMLIDLKQTPKDGDSVPLTLTFDDGSTKTINAPVKRPEAMMQMGGETEQKTDHKMDHSKMKH